MKFGKLKYLINPANDFQEWLLDEYGIDTYNKFCRAIINDFGKVSQETFGDLDISDIDSWSATSEGYDFWEEIHDRYFY